MNQPWYRAIALSADPPDCTTPGDAAIGIAANGTATCEPFVQMGLLTLFDNSLVYFNGTEFASTGCTVDPTEATGVICAPLDATGQSLSFCERGNTGDGDCTSIQLGTTDLLGDVTASVIADGKLPSEVLKPNSCFSFRYLNMKEWPDTLFNDPRKGIPLATIVGTPGLIDDSKNYSCTCSTERGIVDVSGDVDSCKAAISLSVCDQGNATGAGCGLVSQFAGDGTANIEMGGLTCSSTGHIIDLDLEGVAASQGGMAHRLKGRCSDTGSFCSTLTAGTACPTGECIFQGDEGDYVFSTIGFSSVPDFTCAGGTHDTDACGPTTFGTGTTGPGDGDDNPATVQVANCVSGGGSCQSNAEVCFGGTNDGGTCNLVGPIADCTNGGGTCVPAWNSEISEVTVCGELFF